MQSEWAAVTDFFVLILFICVNATCSFVIKPLDGVGDRVMSHRSDNVVSIMSTLIIDVDNWFQFWICKTVTGTANVLQSWQIAVGLHSVVFPLSCCLVFNLLVGKQQCSVCWFQMLKVKKAYTSFWGILIVTTNDKTYTVACQVHIGSQFCSCSRSVCIYRHKYI